MPVDLQGLTADDPRERGRALRSLSESILHQGTLYSATAAAARVLLRLFADPSTPDRDDIGGLLVRSTDSCTGDPSGIRRAWAVRRESFGEIFDRPTAEMAQRELDANMHTGEVFLDVLPTLLDLTEDDEAVSDCTIQILAHFARRIPQLAVLFEE